MQVVAYSNNESVSLEVYNESDFVVEIFEDLNNEVGGIMLMSSYYELITVKYGKNGVSRSDAMTVVISCIEDTAQEKSLSARKTACRQIRKNLIGS